MKSNNLAAFRTLRSLNDPLVGQLHPQPTPGSGTQAATSATLPPRGCSPTNIRPMGSFLHGLRDGDEVRPPEAARDVTWRNERSPEAARDVVCLTAAMPVDQLPRIDAQLAQSHEVAAKYSSMSAVDGNPIHGKELNQFFVPLFNR